MKIQTQDLHVQCSCDVLYYKIKDKITINNDLELIAKRDWHWPVSGLLLAFQVAPPNIWLHNQNNSFV